MSSAAGGVNVVTSVKQVQKQVREKLRILEGYSLK